MSLKVTPAPPFLFFKARSPRRLGHARRLAADGVPSPPRGKVLMERRRSGNKSLERSLLIRPWFFACSRREEARRPRSPEQLPCVATQERNKASAKVKRRIVTRRAETRKRLGRSAAEIEPVRRASGDAPKAPTPQTRRGERRLRKKGKAEGAEGTRRTPTPTPRRKASRKAGRERTSSRSRRRKPRRAKRKAFLLKV